MRKPSECSVAKWPPPKLALGSTAVSLSRDLSRTGNRFGIAVTRRP
jgi:hypothetical protein